ncbi:MAG: hypothetical protein KatS3mg087_1340 [Patescibacteria group bacterium]|nr:MAG: hypothetical protein KatS3mg087_1340 [Patescibacteria group bacterium]
MTENYWVAYEAYSGKVCGHQHRSREESKLCVQEKYAELIKDPNYNEFQGQIAHWIPVSSDILDTLPIDTLSQNPPLDLSNNYDAPFVTWRAELEHVTQDLPFDAVQLKALRQAIGFGSTEAMCEAWKILPEAVQRQILTALDRATMESSSLSKITLQDLYSTVESLTQINNRSPITDHICGKAWALGLNPGALLWQNIVILDHHSHEELLRRVPCESQYERRLLIGLEGWSTGDIPNPSRFCENCAKEFWRIQDSLAKKIKASGVPHCFVYAPNTREVLVVGAFSPISYPIKLG